jgi:hypothetical protein
MREKRLAEHLPGRRVQQHRLGVRLEVRVGDRAGWRGDPRHVQEHRLAGLTLAEHFLEVRRDRRPDGRLRQVRLDMLSDTRGPPADPEQARTRVRYRLGQSGPDARGRSGDPDYV